MSGRSVAEIIGWTEREEYWVQNDTECVGMVTYGPDGKRRYAQRGPTVDDLLAWFVSCGYLPNIDPVGDYDDEVLWSVSLIFAGEHVETEEPTLLAALEAAVRAVAGEDEQ